MKYFFKAISTTLTLLFITAANLLIFDNKTLAESLNFMDDVDVHKTFEDDKKKDSSLPSSPMELMMLLNKYSSMNDATPPSDAIDQALELFDVESEEDYFINN